MKKLSSLIAFATVALVPGCALAQSAPNDTSHSTTVVHVTSKTNGVTSMVEPVFHDVKGKIIDKQAFMQAVEHGSKFKMTHVGGKTADMQLLPAGSKDGTAIDMSASAKLGIKVGQSLPEFKLPLVAGGNIDSAGLAGKVTLVDFFFAQCVACIEELPALNAYAAQHPDMRFLAITFDDAKTAKAFVAKRHFAWPVAYDGKPLVLGKMAVKTFPTLLLLDANGHLLTHNSGSIPVSTIERKSSANDASTPAQPDANARKALQMQWLDQWVDTNVTKPSKVATAQ